MLFVFRDAHRTSSRLLLQAASRRRPAVVPVLAFTVVAQTTDAVQGLAIISRGLSRVLPPTVTPMWRPVVSRSLAPLPARRPGTNPSSSGVASHEKSPDVKPAVARAATIAHCLMELNFFRPGVGLMRTWPWCRVVRPSPVRSSTPPSATSSRPAPSGPPASPA